MLFRSTGDGRGKNLGYPTANIELSNKKKLLPGNGIYVVSVHWRRQSFYGMASIGVRPTFVDHGARTLEVHVLDFHGDLYGQEVEIELLQRLRDEIKFDSAKELIAQMDRDREQTLRVVEEHTKILAGPNSKRIVG